MVGDAQRRVGSAAAGSPSVGQISLMSRASAEMRAALVGIGGSVAEHEAVILDRRAAARGVDDDRVEPAALRSRASRRRYWRAPARAPAPRWPRWWTSAPQQPLARGDDHLDAVPGQQPDRRLVDLGRQHLLGAAGQQRDPRRGARPRPGRPAAGRPAAASCDGRERQHGGERAPQPMRAAAPAKRLARASAASSASAEQRRPRQHARRAARAAAGRAAGGV